MIVCVECRIEMRCAKNDHGADFGYGHVYPGDRFECPECKNNVLICNRVNDYDPAYTRHDVYLKMKNGNHAPVPLPEIKPITTTLLRPSAETQPPAH